MKLQGKKVLVTGSHGFLGQFLSNKLNEKKVELLSPTHNELDLTILDKTIEYFKKNKPEIVIHAAVDGGGIGYMRNHPGSVYFNNILMNTHVVEASRIVDVEKFVGIGTVCSYPKFTKVPFKEEDLWKGYPEETNAAYGLTKKMMLVQTQAYRQQYNFNGIHLLMINLYGPYDNFNLETSHVIPALIRKFSTVKNKNRSKVVLWGSGNASREFLYVEDAADGIILATENYDRSDPINLGSGQEIKIKDLARLIAKMVEYNGMIEWDKTKLDGQPRRRLDVSKAEKLFGFKARTSLEDGLQKTIDWYKTKVEL